MVEFEVRADGSIGDVSILSQGGHGSLNREAIRVVKSMGKWKPARGESGNAIPSLFQVPIQFKLMQRPN